MAGTLALTSAASAAQPVGSTAAVHATAAAPTSVDAAKDRPDKNKPGKNKPGKNKQAVSKKAAKQAAAKKSASKKSAKKSTAKKAASKKSTAKRAAAKRASAKRAQAKRAQAKRAQAKRAQAKRAQAKRAAIAFKKAKARATSIKAPRMIQGRICPTRNFSYGAGWGADRGHREHAGMDMGGRRGTPLFAIESGRIDRTKRQSNGALQIVMKGRSGAKFYYGHMQHVFVRGGQKVGAGQVIGTMGDSGSPGAVHLHFEFWKSGRESAAVNPADLLRTICRAAQ